MTLKKLALAFAAAAAMAVTGSANNMDITADVRAKGLTPDIQLVAGKCADGYGAANLFDGKLDAATVSAGRVLAQKAPVVVTYELPVGYDDVVLTSYALHQLVGFGDLARSPMAWTLSAWSVTSQDWVVLDSRTYTTAPWKLRPNSNDLSDFKVTCEIAADSRVLARKFKFEMTKNNGSADGWSIGLGDLDFLGWRGYLNIDIPEQKFDGLNPVVPVPKVTDLLTGKVLEEGVDYEYVAEGTGALGTGTCTVTGKGEYAGCESVTPFKVVSAYGAGKILYVVPDADDSADEDCSDFAHGGTLANACSRLTDGTAAAPTVIVLKSGTAENPTVYDYSKIVKGDGQHTLAVVSKNYVTIRSMDLNPTNCIVRGGGQAQDLRCLQVTANSRVEGITFEGFGKTGHSAAGDGLSLGFGAAIWAARGTAIANCIFRANFGTDVGAVYYGDVTACAFICNTNEQASGYHVGAGGLYTRGTVRDSYFLGNRSGGDAGALSFYDIEGSVVDNSLFVSNSGSFALFTYGVKTTIATNCVFYRNQCCAIRNGMALDCEFRENRTLSGNAGWPTSAGGANGTTANDCLFVSNETYSATLMAVAHVLAATCTRCTFIGGLALAPEGQTAKGYPCTGTSTLIDCTICDSVFNNSPHYRPARMVGTKFLNCTYTGPAITEISDGTMKDTVISNCVFVGNTTAGTLLNAPNTAPFVNCLIASNRSTRTDWGFLITSGKFCNCTIADNVVGASDGAYPAVAATCVCSNTVVYGNIGYDLEGGAKNLRYCAWGTAAGAAPSDASNRQLARSPFDMTVDAKHPWGFQPRRGSSGLVDKGFSDAAYEAWVPFDLAGDPRVYGNAIDIGCYECNKKAPGLMLILW